MAPCRHILREKKNLNLPKFRPQVPAGHQNKVGILIFFLLSSLTCGQIWLKSSCVWQLHLPTYLPTSKNKNKIKIKIKIKRAPLVHMEDSKWG